MQINFELKMIYYKLKKRKILCLVSLYQPAPTPTSPPRISCFFKDGGWQKFEILYGEWITIYSLALSNISISCYVTWF